MTLRPYQHAALDRLSALFTHGGRSCVLAAPCGSGKTVIAVELIRRHVEAGGRSVFIAPRRELIDQTANKLDSLGLHYGVLMADDPRCDMWAPVQLASIDTLRSRLRRCGMVPIAEPGLVVIDEAHLYVTQHRVDLLNQWPNALRVGLTATPARKDGRGLRVLFDALIEVATVRELTADGYLSPARYYSLSEPDLSRVRLVAGDFNLGDLRDAMAPLVGDVVETWLERAGGRRTVVFAVDIRHSSALCEQFQGRGVVAEHVDANTPAVDRRAVFERFRSGETQVLTNCMLASYGFDLPELDCVVLARPTKSLVLYLQMLGRGLRPADGKTECLVLDHSGAVHKHGFAEDERYWTLDGHDNLADSYENRGASGLAPVMVTCPECRALFTQRSNCPGCGYFFPPKRRMLETLVGELVEIEEGPGVDERVFYQELLGLVQIRQKQRGYAAHLFKSRFDRWPAFEWNRLPALKPTIGTERWEQSRRIAYAKAKRRAGAWARY